LFGGNRVNFSTPTHEMKQLFLYLLFAALLRGALVMQAATTYTEFYCQTTGNNLNAGSTTADSAAHTYTSAIVAGGWDSTTGIFTVASGNPAADNVALGDWASVYVTSGATVATFVARVTATNSTTITVSLTAKSGTAPATDALGATTLKHGGAWKGPNAAASFPFNFVQNTMTDSGGNVPCVNIKSGTSYSMTAGITHSLAGPTRWQGYTTSVRDGGKFTIAGATSGSSYTAFTLSGVNNDLVDCIIQNNGSTGSAAGISATGGECLIQGVVVNSVRGHGVNVATASSTLIECEAYACNQSNTAALAGFFDAVTGTEFIRCISHDNAGSNTSGFRVSTGTTTLCLFSECISDTNGEYGFALGSQGSNWILNCDAYNNILDGVDLNSTAACFALIENSNFVKNGGWGINTSGSATLRNGLIINCGFGSGTQTNYLGQINTIAGINIVNSQTYTANATPWVDPANGDFRINLVGAKGTGRGTFTETAASYTGTVGKPDIGAAQGTSIRSATSTFSQ
jgi:hypothetical protein